LPFALSPERGDNVLRFVISVNTFCVTISYALLISYFVEYVLFSDRFVHHRKDTNNDYED